MQRRIMGIETEFGVTCTFHGHRRLSPDEVARYLFRRVVSWGRWRGCGGGGRVMQALVVLRWQCAALCACTGSMHMWRV